jgi:flagellar basal-body rod protein FlgB
MSGTCPEGVNDQLTLFVYRKGMDITSIPLLAMLRGRMGYFTERQRLVAENVANASTPGYRPRDLAPFRFRATAPAGSGAARSAEAPTVISVTHPAHQRPTGAEAEAAARGYRVERNADAVTTLDGNQVSLEDQMMRMADSRMNYEAAISFYQKSMTMIRTAARAPGR